MGLKHHWKLSDNANDSVGSNNGTANNLTYADGKMGKCGSFNGTNSYISLPNDCIGTGNTVEYSISVWFNCTALAASASRCVIYTNLGYIGLWNNAGTIELICINWKLRNGSGTTNATYESYLSGFTLNAWHNVIMTVATGNSYPTVYVDGMVATTTKLINNWDAHGSTANIGRFVPSYNYYFSGLIDEVMVWDEVLNANQINHLYNQQKRLFIPQILF